LFFSICSSKSFLSLNISLSLAAWNNNEKYVNIVAPKLT
jgi:hypothetical protein